MDIIDAPREYSIRVEVHDPWVDRAEAKHAYRIDCLAALPLADPPLPNPPPPGGRGEEATQPGLATQPGNQGIYDALILAVAHRDFIAMGPAAIRAMGNAKSILYDVKAALPADQVDGRL